MNDIKKGLRQNIIQGIKRFERVKARTYFAVSSVVSSFLLIGVIYSGKYLLESFYQSGFYEYFSLLFSGDGAVFVYWKELSYALVETLPVVGAIIFLVTFTFLLWSLVNLIISARRFILSV